MPGPRITFSDGTNHIELLNDNIKLIDPYWNPKIAQYKQGGNFVNSQLAEGRSLVSKKYDNVVETIPLRIQGTDRSKTMRYLHDLLQFINQAGDYWTETYEDDQVWMEVELNCDGALVGYSSVIKASIAEFNNPFGQSFFTDMNISTLDKLSLVIERKPFWELTKPGTVIGPLYNLIKNSDFELWNFGTENSEPDNWNNLQTTHITGTNNFTNATSKFGRNAIRINVSGSTLSNATKGITQVIEDSKNNTEYTFVGWVKSEGISNGVGRILITYSNQLEIYNSNDAHDWQLYTGKIKTGFDDTIGINCQILTTDANTDGTIYFDSLMLIEGDWVKEAKANILPYMSSSHIVNHCDKLGSNITAGDINYVDVFNIPGNIDSLIRLEIQNNQLPSNLENVVETISKIRVGMRRTNDVFNFDNFYDPISVSDTTASGDSRLTTGGLTTEWRDITSYLISTNTIDNFGRYRFIVRIKDPSVSGQSTLQLRVVYFLGAINVNLITLESELSPIRGDWAILDLTKTKIVNFDTKFTRNTVSQFGYKIQAKRETGIDNFYFDYGFLMPTDGGYMEAEIDPPLNYKNTLIIDNVNFQSVEATSVVENTWIKDYESNDNRTASFVEFKGQLYGIGHDQSIVDAQVMRRTNVGNWEKVFTIADDFFMRKGEVYNGRLYVTGSKGHIYSTENGIEYQLDHTVPPAGGSPSGAAYGLGVFDDKLWIGTDDGSVGGAQGYIVTYDGSTFTQVRLTDQVANDFIVYKNKLYAITRYTIDNLLYQIQAYDPVTNTWENFDFDNTIIPSGDSLNGLGVFNGKLYSGTGSEGYAMIYDGDSWTRTRLLNEDKQITSFIVYNNEFYLLASGELWKSLDAITFTKIFDFDVLTGEMFEFQGQFWFAASTIIYRFSQKTIGYGVPNFRGSSFKAPARTKTNEKRHRYFFNYDRENFINNINDKALIGIGFVPRYLELPIKET